MSSRNNGDVVQREHNLGAASMCGWLSIVGSDCGESGIAQDAITANDAVIIPAATPVQHRFDAQDATTLRQSWQYETYFYNRISSNYTSNTLIFIYCASSVHYVVGCRLSMNPSAVECEFTLDGYLGSAGLIIFALDDVDAHLGANLELMNTTLL